MEGRIRITGGYVKEFGNPISMKSGSRIEVIKRNDGKYKERYWCRTMEGVEAFVPEQLLAVEGNMATFLRDHDSRELTVSRGEVLVSLYEVGEWTWARKSSGEEGWIPDLNAEPFDPF